MAKLISLCNVCYTACPEDEPHPDMCDDCKASYEKALGFIAEAPRTIDPTKYLMYWAANVAREAENRISRHRDFKVRLKKIAAERENNPSIDSTRRLAQEETILNSHLVRDIEFTDWRDDLEWTHPPKGTKEP